MNYIEKIEALKHNLKSEYIYLDELINMINLEKNLDEINYFHTYLMDKIINLSQFECSNINSNCSKDSCDCKKSLLNMEDKKRGDKIYFFNNSSAKYYIFGDIHSDSITLIEFLNKIFSSKKLIEDEEIRLIFLGDYIDRGHAPFKTLELIFILKYLFPENIFLLKGNHDGGKILEDNNYKLCVGRNDGTTDEDYFVASLYNKLQSENKSLKLLQTYLDFFNSLCTLALIKSKEEIIMCVHGGIPRASEELNNYNHLHNIGNLCSESILDKLNDSVTYNMLWSDPSEDISLKRDTRRFYFYEDSFSNFIEKFNIDKIVRGHQAFDEGFKEFFNKQLISIFSSGKCPIENLETAYEDILPCILKIYNGDYTTIRL